MACTTKTERVLISSQDDEVVVEDVLVEDDEQDDDFETRYFRKLGIDVTILPNPKASRRG